MRRAPGIDLAVALLALAMPASARAEEPPPCPPVCPKVATPAEPMPPLEAPPVKRSQEVVAGAAVRSVQQVAAPPPEEHPYRLEEHLYRPAPATTRGSFSDGAGPRITFGRTFTEFLKPGYYGRFETEYFEIRGPVITGMLLGLEGWGTENGIAGGGTIPVSIFAGARGGPFAGPKAPVLFLTVGLGLDVIVYDRVGHIDGFGMLSPFGVATGGIELVPGVRLLADGRAIYRWHWTSASQAQYQLGVTLGLNSYLWDGP